MNSELYKRHSFTNAVPVLDSDGLCSAPYAHSYAEAKRGRGYREIPKAKPRKRRKKAVLDGNTNAEGG